MENPIIFNFTPLEFFPGNPSLWQVDYAYGKKYPIIMPIGLLLSGQLGLLKTYKTLKSVLLIKYKPGGDIVDWTYNITSSFKCYEKEISEIEDLRIFGFNSQVLSVVKAPGLYSLELVFTKSDGSTASIYSNYISFTDILSSYTKIEYSNSYNLTFTTGIINFDNNSKFEIYLDTQVGKPEYEFEEEGDERLGYTFIESVTSKKIYHFGFIANEHLCDAMRIIKLCDTVTIINKPDFYKIDNGYISAGTYKAINFNMDVSWGDQGDLAEVDCSFETDNIVSAVGHYAFELVGHSFNKSYNSDFDSPNTK